MTIYWHGSTELFDTLDPLATSDGGLHVGTRAQAEMRASRVLYEVEVNAWRIRASRDRGGDWRARISDARSKGFDAIRYLNRYEGLTTDRIEALAQSGDLARLDALTDAQFRRLVPEAEESLILLDTDCFRVLSREVRAEKPTS